MNYVWKDEDTLKAIKPLFDAYSQQFTVEKLEFYKKQLSDIPPYILMAAIQKVIDTLQFLPTIAEIRKAAHTMADYANHHAKPDWSVAWQKLEDEVRRIGSYGHPDFVDPYLITVIARIGWANICRTSDNAWLTLRAQFRDDYNALVAKAIERQQCQNAINKIIQNGAPPEIEQKMLALSQRLKLKQ